MDGFSVRPDELRTMAAHFGEAAERLRGAGADVTAAPSRDLGEPAVDAAAAGLLDRWAHAAGALDDLAGGAEDRLVRCAFAYATADGATLRSLGLA